jgi:diguanylate cyclase (GGDEF)-like protein
VTNRPPPVKGAETKQPPRSPARLTGPAIFLAVGLAYAGVSQAVIWMSSSGDLGPLLWPGAGISLAALLLLPERRWAWVIAAVVVAELARNLASGYPLMPSLWWTAANGIEPLIGATLLRRFGNPRGELVPLRKLWRFALLGVMAAPMLGAAIGTLGSLSVVSTSNETVRHVWTQHVASDALGVLAVAPLLLTWRVPMHRRQVAETIAISVGMAAIGFLAVQSSDSDLRLALPFLFVPMLTWSALRFGIRGAAVAVFVMTQIAAQSAAGGPFGAALTADGTAVIMIPIFLIVSGCSVFVLAVVVEDLVERTDVERQLRTEAYRDDLTGLPNRRFLTDHLRQQHSANRNTDEVTVLACDLDDFKRINDGFGHHAGDDVLIEVARRMQDRIGPSDLVCRLNGNEFVVITDLADEPLEAFARDLIAAISEPITMSTGAKLSQSVSIGIAHGPPTAIPEALLRDADVALRHAKWADRGGLHHFDTPLRQLVADRVMIQSQLGDALAAGEITAHYQPEIDITTGRIVCFEALARWNHPTAGLISPGRFMPIIEDMGAAGDLFALMLQDALDARSHWSTQLGFSLSVAVNLSVSQLGDPGLPDTVAAAIRRTRTPPSALCLEVTETALAREPFFDVLLALHHLGIRLAIDDFGTGWSSISRLAAFPWDLLKIDGSFIDALNNDDDHAESVVASTIAMAHSLNMLTIAEGVETPYQLERLAQLGCDTAQGFLFSKALPMRDATTNVSSTGHWTGPPHPRRRQHLADSAGSIGVSDALCNRA